MPAGSVTKLGVCNLCEAICGLVFTLDDDLRAADHRRARQPRRPAVARAHLPQGASRSQDVHEDPDRLRPAGRDGYRRRAGSEISWDEALDLVADGLAAAVNEHGRDALAIYLGNPNVHSLGSLTHGTAMVKSFRTRNKYSATSVDQLPAQLLAYLMYGHQLMLPVPDLDRTQLLPGRSARNPMASNGSLMTVPDFPERLRALKTRGGRMVVVDPRRTETAKVAHEHHFVRPGTDAFVLLAMLHVLFDEGLATPPSYVDGLDAVRAAVAAVHPRARRGRAAASTPTSSDGWRASSPRRESAAVYGRVGVSTQEFGLVATWAVQLLNLLTGNLDRPGRRDAHPPGRRRGRARAGRARATTTCGAAGCAACRSSAASCRSRRWPTRSSPRARARSGRC